jgi:protein TonB
MDANKILKSNLLDLVFDNRNKAYGAYELRVTYPERIKRALLITLGAGALIFAGSLWANSQKPTQVKTVDATEYNLAAIEEPEPEPLPPPEQQPQEPPPAEREVQYTAPVLAEVVDEPPPSLSEIDNANISTKNVDGVDPTNIIVDEPVKDNTGVLDVPVKKEPDIWEKVEVAAKFDGDWSRYLTRNLRAEVPVDNNAPAGRYKVQVKFVVDVDGTISDIVPLTNVGYGMEQEAMRVIRQSKKWVPAFQNTKHVKAYHIQNIVFEVVGDE